MMDALKRLTALLLLFCMLMPACLAEGQLEIVEDDEEDFFFIDTEDSPVIEIIDDERDTSIDPNKLDKNENLPDNIVNILLIGVDTRGADLDEGYQHGDVQIVVSINKDDGSIKLTSLLRDLYVTIPGYKSKNRINVAYARGGGQLAMRTVNRNFDLNIEHYITINFYGLASIIDALGGIDIEMTKAEARAVNAYIKKNLHKSDYDNQDSSYEREPLPASDGVHHCDGIQAVMYARVRSIDNDFARTGRQRKLMELLLAKVLDGGMSYTKLKGLLETCLPYAKTNMTFSDLASLAVTVVQGGVMDKLANGEPLLEQHRVPMDGTYSYLDVDGASVVNMGSKSFPKNVQALHEFIYGEYIPAD